MKIKKNDNVIVITGKDKGKTGMVKAVFPKDNKVLVVGVNRMMRHVKPTQTDPQGGRRQIEAPIHISNVAHVDPKDNKPTRVGFKMLKDRKVRFAKRSGEQID
jgi:large subunit ribosomal protein L24